MKKQWIFGLIAAAILFTAPVVAQTVVMVGGTPHDNVETDVANSNFGHSAASAQPRLIGSPRARSGPRWLSRREPP